MVNGREHSWETIGREEVYSGRVRLVDHTVVLRDGTRSRYEVDENIPFAGATLVIDGEYVIVARQYRYPLDRWIYDLPGGAGGENDAPESAARRELEEELGLIPNEMTPLHIPDERPSSHSDCLRQPRKDAYALRGLLSALHSAPVADTFAEVAGTPSVSYMTADIARYRPGHYLRRHDDVYDGRVFGLVFFLHETWDRAADTRLIAEKPDGRCAVMEPLPNTVAVMRLANGHYHQVEQNLSTDWDRYSIAVHFGVKDA